MENVLLLSDGRFSFILLFLFVLCWSNLLYLSICVCVGCYRAAMICEWWSAIILHANNNDFFMCFAFEALKHIFSWCPLAISITNPPLIVCSCNMEIARVRCLFVVCLCVVYASHTLNILSIALRRHTVSLYSTQGARQINRTEQPYQTWTKQKTYNAS